MTHPPTPATTPLPCPFCGGKTSLMEVDCREVARINCAPDCLMNREGYTGYWLDKWNRRAAPPVPPVATAEAVATATDAACGALMKARRSLACLRESLSRRNKNLGLDVTERCEEAFDAILSLAALRPAAPVARSGEVEAAITAYGDACYDVGFVDADRESRTILVSDRNALRSALLALYRPAGETRAK